MALLTTGWIKNPEISGVRPSSTFSVRIINNDPVGTTVQIRGFYLDGTSKTEYVSDLLTLGPGGELNSDYYAQFDGFEFQFITSTDAIEISASGKNITGNLSVIIPLLQVDFNSLGGIAGATENLKRIYVPNSYGNNVSAIDAKNNTLQGNIIVGSGPIGIGINQLTNRIYVANYGSNDVSVIDGNTDAVVATVAVNYNPLGVGINTATNRIYVTNQGSNNVSVIDGLLNIVIETITVGASPGGVAVSSATNKIYVTNQGSDNVSVINASTNTVIATVEIAS
jgi:40-residue YVTN family beta-propeller repeat